LTIAAAGSIAVVTPNASKMIVASSTGQLIKNMAEGTSFTYPIGDNIGTPDYSPITLSLNGDNSANINFGVTVVNAKHPNNSSSTAYLNRYWNVSQTGNVPDLVTAVATYTASDLMSTEATIAGASLTGSFNQSTNPWIKHAALSGNTLTMTGILVASNQTTVFTGITGANPTINLIGMGTTCYGSTVALNTTVAADATVLYNWSPSDFLSTTTSANPTAAAITATTTYTVMIKDGNGISASATGTLAVGNTTTWTGAWNNGVPTSTSAVIIASNYTATTALSCCSLTVTNNAAVVIPSGFDVNLYGPLTVSSGSFTLANNANLLQSSDAANSGNIIVQRTSSALLRQDYTLWSSPVSGQQLLAFSPLTLATRFYTYDSPSNIYVAFTPTIDFATAKGYLIRMPNNHPTTATVWNGTFTGVPHNGNYSFAIVPGDATHRFNLVGNPYPSPIRMVDFVSENSNTITGALYFWRKTNNALSPSYCSWVGGTFVNNGEAQVVNPNGIIRTGQGFFVEAKALATSVSFSNAQRVSNTANQFFRTGAPEETNRIWLNATDAAGSFSQMEVGYVTNATQELDAYDGNYINDGAIEFYSLVAAQKLVIQGRALPFDTSDIVPLGFKTSNVGTYSIAIDHSDGLFAGSQAIFIKDHLTGAVHDLKTGTYSFDSESGTFDSRFELAYTSSLGNQTVAATDNSVIVYKNKEDVVIHSSTAPIASVQIFDARGRLLTEKKAVNSLTTSLQGTWSAGLLFVHITFVSGDVVVKKVLW
jgi:hypothetical protein